MTQIQIHRLSHTPVGASPGRGLTHNSIDGSGCLGMDPSAVARVTLRRHRRDRRDLIASTVCQVVAGSRDFASWRRCRLTTSDSRRSKVRRASLGVLFSASFRR